MAIENPDDDKLTSAKLQLPPRAARVRPRARRHRRRSTRLTAADLFVGIVVDAAVWNERVLQRGLG